MDPRDLKFNPSHEWVGVVEDAQGKIAVVGITDFALEQLTDLVYMELPAVGAHVTQGEQFGEVESVKAVSPLYSPVSGEVVEVHGELVDQLENLASDPYDNGWLIKVRLTDSSQLDRLLDRQTYVQQCGQ
ncbi:MAG: glycine cleavage system protein GcvH [Pirellulaceae bacterium]|nr:glycine cleavage system protein GcvH [Pirellulaceae bacterium]